MGLLDKARKAVETETVTENPTEAVQEVPKEEASGAPVPSPHPEETPTVEEAGPAREHLPSVVEQQLRAEARKLYLDLDTARRALADRDRQIDELRATVARERAASRGLPRDAFEFAMLYGIRRAEQLRLAHEGHGIRVLVSYGAHWFPWYMRRLAERPANVLFVVRGMLGS